MKQLKLIIATLLVITPFAAVNAMPIAYSLTLEVDTVLDTYGPSDPVYQVGNLYFGFFVIDDAILQNDGVNQAGDLLDFVISIEDYLWSTNFLSDFAGFHGPDYFGSSPGFDVQNGEIVNLVGGVYGDGDIPIVDFGSFGGAGGDNRFSALMLDCSCYGRSQGHIQGSLNVARIQVSEPGTLALLGLGLAGIGLAKRKKA